MTAVAAVHVRHFVAGVRVGRPFVISVAYVVHLKAISAGAFILQRSLCSLTSRKEGDKIKPTSASPREYGTAKKHRPTLSRTIYLATGAILEIVIVFPSVATSPVNWTLAPAFATSAAKF